MSDHEIRVTSSRGLKARRWYVNCKCGWEIATAVRDGDAVENDGYFGRATEADARALGDLHVLKATTTMPRRMQANPKYSLYGHGREHDETPGCALGTPCTPVADTDSATVAVPATGTVLVVDGVVQDIDPGTVTVSRDVDRKVNAYYMETRPKPTFFEVGKRYRFRRADGTYRYFVPDAIKSNPGGEQVAFGRIEDDAITDGGSWEVRYSSQGWTEV